MAPRTCNETPNSNSLICSGRAFMVPPPRTLLQDEASPETDRISETLRLGYDHGNPVARPPQGDQPFRSMLP